MEEYLTGLEHAGEFVPIGTFRRQMELLREHGFTLGMPIARIIDRQDRIYELRFGSHRCAYAAHSGRIVLLHAWRKRSQRLDALALSEARRNLAELRIRTTN